jgi:hypothetical protein
MTLLETLKFDYKTTGKLDPVRLFNVLDEQAARIARLETGPVMPAPTTPYTEPEAH